MDNMHYIHSRKIAIVITMFVLLFGTVFYFATNIADRNNEMMYKEIYGENATIRNSVVDTNITNIQSVKTALV
jgi:hypothetical protein